jgi:hypothetical protein
VDQRAVHATADDRTSAYDGGSHHHSTSDDDRARRHDGGCADPATP